MGFIDLFVERDKPSKAKAPVQGDEVVAKKITPITVGDFTPYSGVDASLVQQFRLQFAKILADENTRNFPGNDYYEFVVMKNAMQEISQEDIKYRAAYAGWMAGGKQTKESLISTAKVYLGLVDREIKEFEEAYNLQHNQTIAKNELAIEKKTQEVQQMMSKINQLNAEIQALKTENSTQSSNLTTKHAEECVKELNSSK